jgi:hypothetical protein
MPPRRNSSCQRSEVLPKTRQELVPRPAVHQLQAKLAAGLSPPVDRSTAQDKTRTHAAPRSTPTSTQRTRPLRCHPAATHRASGTKYSPRQDQCSFCPPHHADFPPRQRRMHSKQVNARAAPCSTPTLKQRARPTRCHHAAIYLASEHRMIPGKGSARAASRSTPTSSHAGGGRVIRRRPGTC